MDTIRGPTVHATTRPPRASRRCRKRCETASPPPASLDEPALSPARSSRHSRAHSRHL